MPLLKPLWKSFGSRTVDLSVDAGGTMRAVDVRRVEVSVPKVLDIKLKGRFSNVMKPQYMRGAVDIDGRMTGGSYLKRALALPADVNVPAVALKERLTTATRRPAASCAPLPVAAKWLPTER